MSRSLLRGALLASVSLALAPLVVAAPGDVWTVAASGADFTEIQAAVDAAADGDLILVQPGTYAGFQIVDRSVTVVAEQPGTVQALGRVSVSGLAPTRRVALIDLSVTSPSITASTWALRVEDCQGSVRVRGGTWKTSTPAYGPAWQADVTAVRVEDCDDVAFNGVVGQGANGYSAINQFYGPTPGGGGLRVVDSAVAAFHSQFLAGKGGFGDDGESGAGGGIGLDVQHGPHHGFVHLASLEAHGGAGGAGGAEKDLLFFEPAGNGGKGGDGLRLVGPTSGAPQFANLLALTSSGAPGGPGGWGFQGPPGSPGAPGQALATSGLVMTIPLAGPVKRLVTQGLWRAGTPTTLEFSGTPGDQIFLAVSVAPGFTRVGSKQGVSLLGGKPWIVPMGTIGANFKHTVSVTPALPAGWEGRVLHLQAWMAQVDGVSVLTAASTVAIVDPTL